ncbi:MAG: AmmeMemoRadiSam system protein A [Chloroflexi bacterium CFX2]|nr:AmmeMemoRadiSam system protein A [Chloroflexi bacterium CFX2]
MQELEGKMSIPLTDGEKRTLLRLAREAIEYAVRGKKLQPLDPGSLTPSLLEKGASFVTLTIRGDLRGCIGALEAYQPLAEDVREHAISAAMDDPRFPPVTESELSGIHIEVSRLTAPQELEYSTGEDLMRKLRPHIDGVILKHGFNKATFLPQVWEKIPDPAEFLDQLCYKMGERSNLWRNTRLQVYTYQVEEFHELN